MDTWALIVGYSVVTGILCARIRRRSYSLVAAGFIPWFSLLAALLVSEYLLPYRGGGASMWPIAQLFGGTAALLVGLASCELARHMRGGHKG